MARREEKVDAELLARLESGGGDKIRVPLPNRKVKLAQKPRARLL